MCFHLSATENFNRVYMIGRGGEVRAGMGQRHLRMQQEGEKKENRRAGRIGEDRRNMLGHNGITK